MQNKFTRLRNIIFFTHVYNIRTDYVEKAESETLFHCVQQVQLMDI